MDRLRSTTPLALTGFLGALCAAALAAAAPAHAAPIFTARASVIGAPINSNTGGSGATASAALNDPRDEGVRSGSALAAVGTQRIAASAQAAVEPVLFEFAPEMFGFGRLSATAGGSAFLRYFDIMFTRDDGADGDISVSTRISVEGVLTAPATPGLSSAAAIVEYGLGVPGPGSTAVADSIGQVRRSYNSNVLSTSATGIFDGLTANDTLGFDLFLDTPSFVVPLNTPVSLALELIAGASVTTQDGDSIRAAANFSQTLLLGYDGAVFNLPDGVSASSISAGIANNQFAMVTAPAPIPIPPAGALLLAAIGGLYAAARRRRPTTAC